MTPASKALRILVIEEPMPFLDGNIDFWRHRLLWFCDDLDRAGGDGLEEGSAVIFGNYPWIQNNYNPRVFLGAYQSAEALFKFDDGFGKLVIEKGAAACLLDLFQAGLEQRIVGNGKGELEDDDIAQAFAWYVHTLPEAVGSE